MSTIPHMIGGAPRAEGGARIDVIDPATGAVTGHTLAAGTDLLDEAVATARAAQEKWGNTSLTKRAAVLFRFRELLAAKRGEVAAAISAEHGKTLPDADGEITRGLEVVEFACGLPHLLQGRYTDQISTGVDVWSYREPVGVTAGITPFNFPAMVPLWMCPIALATGNAFLLKPSERVPSAAVKLAELWAEAGLPAGLFQVLHGGPDLVNAILDHPGIDSASFVGSTPIAKHVYERGTAAGKRVQALGGAKNHAIVMPDANLDDAAAHLVAAGYGSAGQRCMAISAVVAVGTPEQRQKLVDAVAAKAREVKVGPYTDDEAEMGPLITAASRTRILDAVAEAEQLGARVDLDGRDLTLDGEHAGGNFVGPILLSEVPRTARAYTEELFGPVLTVVSAASLEEALDIVNGVEFGNGAAIFTGSGAAARTFQRSVQAGMVGINVPIPVPAGSFSFGGRKASLFGDTHVYGAEGVQFYTRAKVITGRWPADDVVTDASLAFPSTGAQS